MKPIFAEKLLTPEEFDGIMTYVTGVRGDKSRNMAHAFHVLGLPLSVIATQNDCSRQNVVRALERFSKGYERYTQVMKNMTAGEAPTAALVLLAPAAKKATKPAAKKAGAPAAKKVAATATKKKSARAKPAH